MNNNFYSNNGTCAFPERTLPDLTLDDIIKAKELLGEAPKYNIKRLIFNKKMCESLDTVRAKVVELACLDIPVEKSRVLPDDMFAFIDNDDNLKIVVCKEEK